MTICHRATLFGALLGSFIASVGCSMPNSSNPTLSIHEARISGDTVALRMQIDNPSDMDLRIDAAEWTLVFGPLPVADGEWSLGFVLPKKGSRAFTQSVQFASPPLDPGAEEIELAGSLRVQTAGNSGNTALRGAGFSVTRRVTR